MVLRGSKTHPQYDFIEVTKAVETTKSYLTEIESREREIEHKIVDVIHQELQQELNINDYNNNKIDNKLSSLSSLSTSAQTSLVVSSELTNALAILIDRLEFLENKHKEAELNLNKYQKEVRIAMLQLLSGGIAGAIARTVVAPIDRIKLLIQTSRTRGIFENKSMLQVATEEINKAGVISLWKGNSTNVIRVFPYAAIQFASYERFKHGVIVLCEKYDRNYGFFERLIAGACAGATAATLTYPLDVIRVRQAVYDEYKGPWQAAKSLYGEGGMLALYKGWVPTVLSLAPFIAVNFATFDYLKSTFTNPNEKPHPLKTLMLGATAGLIAQTFCYPTDTIRRNMQMKGEIYTGVIHCIKKMWADEGFKSYYRGMIPNAIKIVPNNGIRFVVYTQLSHYFSLPKKGGGGD